MSDDKFVIDRLFPTQEIHLIFGPSGAGATTLLLQLIRDYAGSKPFLGLFPANPEPQPFCFVGCTKSIRATRAHMRDLGMDPMRVPHISLASRDLKAEDRSFHNVLTIADRQVNNRMRVLFIDGLQVLCDKVSDDRVVSQFMSHIVEVCGSRDITVIATMRASKARTGEGYVSIRERIIGSGAFCSFADTKIGIEQTKISDPTNPNRTVTFLPQRFEPTVHLFDISDDGLEPASQPEESTSKLDRWLSERDRGDSVTSGALIELCAGLLSESSVRRWIRIQCKLGALEKTRHGEYRVPLPA